MANPELDEHFERLLKAISAMRAPEIHVHVNTAEAKRKRAAAPAALPVEEVNPSPVPYTG